MKILPLSLVAVGLSLAAADPTLATACFNPQMAEPCMAYWNSAAVFLGKAVAVRRLPDEKSLSTRFEVVEAFVGVSGPEVEVKSRTEDEAFGYEFAIGESYMIYAFRAEDGALMTSMCRGTGPLARAGDDLIYARQAVRNGPRTSIFGSVAREERPAIDKALTIKPLAGVWVTVEGSGGRRFSAVTNGDGEFEVTGPDEGSWLVRAAVPPGEPPAAPVEVQVPPGRCALAKLSSTMMGRVHGRLLDAQGRPAARRWVYLAPASSLKGNYSPVPSEAVETDGEGRYAISQIPASEYVLLAVPTEEENDPLLPPIFFPGTREPGRAGRLRVEASSARAVQDFRLPPPLASRKIAGVVRWPDGRPVDDVRVSLRDGDLETNMLTDTDGSFELSGFAGQSYEVRAACTREGGILETERRRVTPGSKEIRVELVLNRPAPASAADGMFGLDECPQGPGT
jgi:hypothetical protein